MAESDGARSNGHHITWAHVWSIVPLAVMGLIAWGMMTADFRALAQRVDQGEKRDEKTGDALDVLKGAVIELRSDGKALRMELERQGRQLDRIEGLIRNNAPPPQPARTLP